MKLGLHLIPDSWESFKRRARAADEAGFDSLWVAESSLTVQDVYVALTVAAGCTERVRLGPGCTNVVLRHEAMVAAALGSIDELAPGRVFCAIGSGDTPIRALGRSPSKVDEMRVAVEHIRELTAGREVEYAGRGVSLTWAKRQMPVYVTAEGPRTLQMAAEVADGILNSSGTSAEVRGWLEEQVGEGCRRAGRAREDVELWLSSMLSLGSERGQAREAIRPRVANRARHNMMAAPQLVPAGEREAGQRLIDNFDVNAWYDPKHAGLVNDYMVDRFAIAGTVEDVVASLGELERAGVQGLMLDFPMQSFDATLEIFAQRVMPELSLD
ncbi:MAG TPA: LLM class flavin-dependent oxidoreductase [Candidatus Nitrosotalea sp.]|nr:LLM class flavin-dependent oxidoreductase [Candidatus Nitrosotalea sp.]